MPQLSGGSLGRGKKMTKFSIATALLFGVSAMGCSAQWHAAVDQASSRSYGVVSGFCHYYSTPFQCELWIYTSDAAITRKSPGLPLGPPAASFLTDEDGFFWVELPAGDYCAYLSIENGSYSGAGFFAVYGGEETEVTLRAAREPRIYARPN